MFTLRFILYEQQVRIWPLLPEDAVAAGIAAHRFWPLPVATGPIYGTIKVVLPFEQKDDLRKGKMLLTGTAPFGGASLRRFGHLANERQVLAAVRIVQLR